MKRLRHATVFLVLTTILGTATAQGNKLDAVVLKARAALQKRDYRKTIDLLRYADRTGKDRRVKTMLTLALNRRAMAYHKRGKMDLAYRDLYSANRLTPNNELILQSLGVVTHALGRKRDAEDYMKRVLRINPRNSAALGVLGVVAKDRGDTASASKYFAGASKSKPGRKDYRQLANKFGREAKVEGNFVTSDKGNFRVQFERGKTVGVENAVNSVHTFLAQAQRELAKIFGSTPNGRITVVVYNTTQFRRVNTAKHWARAYFDGKIRVAIKSWPAGRSELRKDLRHELTHAFLHKLYPKAPTWLHEGLAQQVEGTNAALARGVFKGGQHKLLPMQTFLSDFTNTRNSKLAAIGYAQSLMLIGHLQKLGNRRKMQELLRHFRSSSDSNRAVKMVYGKSIERLLKDAMR